MLASTLHTSLSTLLTIIVWLSPFQSQLHSSSDFIPLWCLQLFHLFAWKCAFLLSRLPRTTTEPSAPQSISSRPFFPTNISYFIPSALLFSSNVNHSSLELSPILSLSYRLAIHDGHPEGRVRYPRFRWTVCSIADYLQLPQGLTSNRKLDVLPVTRVTKARGSALFVTSSAVRLLILYFRYNEHLANPFSNPRTCVKALTMLIFKWTGARMGDIAAPEGSEQACLR